MQNTTNRTNRFILKTPEVDLKGWGSEHADTNRSHCPGQGVEHDVEKYSPDSTHDRDAQYSGMPPPATLEQGYQLIDHCFIPQGAVFRGKSEERLAIARTTPHRDGIRATVSPGPLRDASAEERGRGKGRRQPKADT